MKPVMICGVALAAIVSASTASAQQADVAWNVGVVSDYVFRGVSQTDGAPAFQAGVDVDYGGFYAGAWASSVDFGDSTDAEVDLYGGYRIEAAGFAIDLGAAAFIYVDPPAGSGSDYLEFKAEASRAIGPATLGAAVYYSPDFYGADERAVYVEANAAWALTSRWTLSGAVGHQSLDVGDDYLTWNAGAAFALSDHVEVDVRYHDTDEDDVLSDGRIVAGLKLSF